MVGGYLVVCTQKRNTSTVLVPIHTPYLTYIYRDIPIPHLVPKTHLLAGMTQLTIDEYRVEAGY